MCEKFGMDYYCQRVKKVNKQLCPEKRRMNRVVAN